MFSNGMLYSVVMMVKEHQKERNIYLFNAIIKLLEIAVLLICVVKESTRRASLYTILP